jgi:RNA recognition motif-containing protein
MAVIYVSNIDHRSTEANLRSVFEMYGRVASIDLVAGLAFVEMQDEGQAKEAVSDLSDHGSWVVRTIPAVA